MTTESRERTDADASTKSAVAEERRVYLQYVDACNWQRVTFRDRHLFIEAAGVGSTYHRPIQVGMLQFNLTATPTRFPDEEVEALWRHFAGKQPQCTRQQQ